MGAIESQITSLIIVYSIVYSDTDQRNHEGSASLVFVRGNHRWPVNSPHKWPVTQKMFPFDDVIMKLPFLTSIWRMCVFMIRFLRKHNWDQIDVGNIKRRLFASHAIGVCEKWKRISNVVDGIPCHATDEKATAVMFYILSSWWARTWTYEISLCNIYDFVVPEDWF